MHPTSVFHWSDRAEMLSFVRARSFATLVDESLRVAQVPFIVDEREERLLCHFARSNPMVRSLPTRVVAVVNGADAYVSPDWYRSHDQVPTWDYESVEIVGNLSPLLAQLLDILANAYPVVDGRWSTGRRRLRENPDWYRSHDQVPTWDYESVEIVGNLSPLLTRNCSTSSHL
jgi:predicted FMN-binding regulatory protein PaiB